MTVLVLEASQRRNLFALKEYCAENLEYKLFYHQVLKIAFANKYSSLRLFVCKLGFTASFLLLLSANSM